MSELFLCKIIKDQIITPTGSEMVDLLPVTLDWKNEFLLDYPNNSTCYEEFYQMVDKFIKETGSDKALENFYDCSFFSSASYTHLSELLHGNLSSELKSDDCFSLEYYYFGNNFLAEILPINFKRASLRQLSIDAENLKFWDEYHDCWWSKPLRDRLIQGGEDHQQYQVVNYLIRIHTSWLNEKLTSSPFASNAFAVPY
jgi:hypothetical protein